MLTTHGLDQGDLIMQEVLDHTIGLEHIRAVAIKGRGENAYR